MGAYDGANVGMGDDESLFQVMKAVEDAELTINKQMEENNRLKNELLRKTQELERYRLEARSAGPLSGQTISPSKGHLSNFTNNDAEGNHYSLKTNSTLVVHQEPSAQTGLGDQHFSLNNIGPSHFSPSSSRSLSPNKHRKEGEQVAGFNNSGNSLLPITEANANAFLKQEELIFKFRKQEEEIAQLKRYLVDYSVKEAQIRNEKYVLEKRISYMRMAFDQQQQDLVDAASKAISYRQEIIEENIRLTYALQAAQAEKSTFVSSILPLLSEYDLQPSVLDAQSIVSNLKVLFRHMQEKLLIAEEKLKEFEYQLAPLNIESSNTEGLPLQSSNNPAVAENKNSLDLVPLPSYMHSQSAVSSCSDMQTRLDMEFPKNQNLHHGATDVAGQNVDSDNLLGISPSVSESKESNPSFKDIAKVGKNDDIETTTVQHGREQSHWASGSSSVTATGNDDPSYYPCLPPVLEEPISFSEAAYDDPLPAIEGLRISGEAFPGKELQASGYSINGTTACNFEWVRSLEDGSVQYIEGAKQPTYLVTADDVDSYLAIEVQPLDDRKRKGALVRVFANEQRKITCAPEMQEQIKRDLSVGHVSYEVLLSIRHMGTWERAVLAIKREGYSIKCYNSRVVVSEKFKPTTAITIPIGHPTEFCIQDANSEFLLKSEDSSELRDTIVLTMRGFKLMAAEKRKAKKKGLFFK